jgi:carboxymethylenebutenolidase
MQEPNVQIDSESLQVPAPNSGRQLEAYWAAPAGAGPHPGLLVIHEIHGLNDDIRNVCRRLAAEGYAALAVDLFSNRSRPVCMLQIFYGLLVKPLASGTLADLQTSLDYLRQRPKVLDTHVGAIGFCMGGSYALQLACVDDGMSAASVFYGQNPRPLEAVAQACPIVGSYPGRDFTARAAKALETALSQTDIPHDLKTYPEARHSFFNTTGPAYDAAASADAWQRTLSFFETHLRPR